jgi:hypothetical protein
MGLDFFASLELVLSLSKQQAKKEEKNAAVNRSIFKAQMNIEFPISKYSEQ